LKMNIYKYVFFVFVFGIGLSHGQTTLTNNTPVVSHVKEQADIMGKAFLKGDYQTFAKYTYPAIVNAMGGESRMATVLANSASSMKTPASSSVHA